MNKDCCIIFKISNSAFNYRFHPSLRSLIFYGCNWSFLNWISWVRVQFKLRLSYSVSNRSYVDSYDNTISISRLSLLPLNLCSNELEVSSDVVVAPITTTTTTICDVISCTCHLVMTFHTSNHLHLLYVSYVMQIFVGIWIWQAIDTIQVFS